jgi:hypothetical protein
MSKQDRAIARMMNRNKSNAPVITIDWRKMKPIIIGLIIGIIILLIFYIFLIK